MGRKCCVPQCHGGYALKKSELGSAVSSEGGTRLSFHAFPQDPSMRDNQHFIEEDFRTERSDVNKTRSGQRGQVRKSMLKQKAFPSKFPGLSTYLSKAVPKERKSETGFQKRFENTVSRHNEQTQTFFKAHNIECFEEILDKLAREILPQGVVTLFKNDEELILGKVVRDHEGTPEIQFSIVIQQDLSFQLFNGRSSLSLNAVKHIQVGNQIKNVNVLVNILAFMKSMSEKDNYDHDQIHALLNQLKNEINKNNEDSCLQKQLFALEQLQLAPKSTKQKRSVCLTNHDILV
eukprot:TCALIF_13839-PA protein Name:"Protein of unknown function" AED:0.25 eAED:0.40 QI:0/0/0/1/1/1/2/0/290